MSRRWSSPFDNLRAFLQSFGPGVTGELVSDLVRQLSLTTKGITLVIDMLNGVGIPEDTTHVLAQLKDDADHLHSEFIDSLTRALVTPLDREDLYRYSREIRDLMDELRDFAREWRLLHTGSDEVLLRVVCQLANALDAARRGTEKLAHPTRRLVLNTHPERIRSGAGRGFPFLACLDGADLSKACFVLLVEKELMDSILAGVA